MRNSRYDNLVDIRQRLVISNQHLCKLGALLGVDAHDTAKQEDVVGRVADLLGIQDDLLELTGLRKALNHLRTITPPVSQVRCSSTMYN